MHACAAKGCGKQVPDRHLMCGRHWRMVPESVANRVTMLWEAFHEGRDRRSLDAYRAARAEAIRAVEVGSHE